MQRFIWWYLTITVFTTNLYFKSSETPALWRTAGIINSDGLSNSAITCIYSDSRGFMWFGSWDGLNRYDGKTIKRFYPNLYDKNSISNNIIRQILEDKDNNLWIVTEQGINKYSHHTENFIHWFSDLAPVFRQENNMKAHIGADGQIWIVIKGYGFFRYSPDKNHFDRVQLKGVDEYVLKSVENFHFHDNSLYLQSGNTIIHYDSRHNFVVKRTGFNIEAPVTTGQSLSWFFMINKKPFFLRNTPMGGVIAFDIELNTSMFIKPADSEFLITAASMLPTNDFIWLGADDGSIWKIYPLQNFRVESVSHFIPGLTGKRVKIWAVVETPDSLLWIGTDGEGVMRVNLNSKPFYNISKGTAQQRELNHQIVRAIYEDKDENLWIGTRGNGLNLIPAGNGMTRHYNTSNGLTNNAVLSLQEDNNGNLWIGHDGIGIDLLHLASGRIYNFPRDLKGAEELTFGSVYDICIDAFSQVWLATSGYGVIGLDVKFNNGQFSLANFTHIRSDENNSLLGSNIVYAIVEEKPNILWLGTRGAGIYRFNTLTGGLENFTKAIDGKPGLIDNDILSLYMGEEGILWVGSSGGLSRVNINYTPYEFKHYSTLTGLPNNTIHSIIEDSNNNIWVSTNKGLSKLLFKENRFLNFNSDDGLQSNEYTDGAAFAGKTSGRFYFGGINGIDWFYPEEIKISTRQPRFLFTGLKIYNQSVTAGDDTQILSSNINDLEKIVLRHNQNFFTIEFTTINYINPQKSLFEYKLENFHNEWVYAGDNREAIFTNVPYGTYRLLVRATNEDGIWSNQQHSLQIVIRPPFWKTWPAFTIYALIFFLLIMMIIKNHSSRIKRRQQLTLEKLQQQKEKEITQYKLEFFTNLAHEFGTPLTLIFASAASLLNPKISREESGNLVKTIYQNSRRMQKLVQELLEFRKVETRREKVLPAPAELISTIHNVVEVFSHYVRENELDISFEPEIHELWIITDTGKLEKILGNLLSNAIKYTAEGGRITVAVRVSNDTIDVMVADTGIGITSDVIPYIFDPFYQYSHNTPVRPANFKGIGIGLSYTRSLVELLGGTIKAESSPGKGSTFTVSLPFRKTDAISTGSLPLRRSLIIDNLAPGISSISPVKIPSIDTKRGLWTTPKKYCILIAEDDQELANMLLRLLSEQYEVNLASNGRIALDFINHKRVDLLVSDIIMPEIDGLKLCKTIKSNVLTSHIPVILLTHRSEIENRIEGLEMGADSYIPKPFHPKHLFVRIEKLLKSKEQISEYFKKNFGTPAHELHSGFSNHDKDLLSKCISFIEIHFADENIDADQLASHLAMSKAQLYRKIKALTGLTPHGLIKNYRLKKARQLIAEGSYAITDIIYMTGFNNRTYFYRSYKEAFGETPGELNKNINLNN